MRGAKVKTIAGFELVSTIRRPAYLTTTFGMPLFLAAYVVFGMLIGSSFARSEKKVSVYGLIDLAHALDLGADTAISKLDLPSEALSLLKSTGAGKVFANAGQDLSATFRPYPDEAGARAALADGTISAYYRLGPDYHASGHVDVYFPPDASFNESGARSSLQRLLRNALLARTVAPDDAARIARPIGETAAWTITEEGEVTRRARGAQVAGVVIPIAFAILLFISLAMSTGYLIQGTAAEKESKVGEVLLAAAGPDEILFGKLLGLGGAGLLQISVWFGMIVLAAYLFAATFASLGVKVPWVALAAAPPFFALAYFFMGSLILGTSSLGKSFKEVQQLGMVWSLASALPLMFIGILVRDPNGLLGHLMTWIPFSAPVTVVLRLSLGPDGIAWWEVAGAFAIMIAATWLALGLGARLFRIGLLLTGSRPKWRELLRQARLGGA